MNALTGEKYSVNLTLTHDGNFGFKATLTFTLRKQDAGLFANLYHFDPSANQLVYVTSSKIDANGNAAVPFGHASSYTIIVDDHPHDEEDDEADEIISEPDISGDTGNITPTGSISDVTENADPDANPHTGTSAAGLALVIIAGAAVLVSRKRK